MLYGHVRDRFPRLLLSLPWAIREHTVEFVLDTGFDGELTVPTDLARRIEVRDLFLQKIRLADGELQECLQGEVVFEWHGESRPTEVLLLDGNPLLGMQLLDGCHVCFHVSDGGEVTVEEG